MVANSPAVAANSSLRRRMVPMDRDLATFANSSWAAAGMLTAKAGLPP
jgi:hypothetical protein